MSRAAVVLEEPAVKAGMRVAAALFEAGRAEDAWRFIAGNLAAAEAGEVANDGEAGRQGAVRAG